MTAKERTARVLADFLLEGGQDRWAADDVFAFIEADGWRWDGAQWKQRPQDKEEAL
jgi:hypothetical protein